MKPDSIYERNRRNAKFWAVQSKLTDERLRNPVVAAHAFRVLETERLRAVPVCYQTSLEHALEVAANFEEAVIRKHGNDISNVAKSLAARRAACSPRKGDCLRRWLADALRKQPKLTLPRVVRMLRDECGSGFVVDIKDDTFILDDDRGHLLTITHKALKARFYRAKEKLR